MENKFEKEDRYIVIKRKDLGVIPSHLRSDVINAIRAARLPSRECLVIESDWPEFEPTWAAIERRVTGRIAADFKPGDVETVGDCGKWSAYIDDESHRTPSRSTWYSRIQVLGDTKEDAKQLRDRVLDALNPTPEPAPVEWNGEGIPPVGTVCEVKGCMSHYLQWNKVTVFAVRGKTVMFDMADGRWGQTDSHEFRPIRTLEQIAAEEREKAIVEMARGMMAGLVAASDDDFKRAEKLAIRITVCKPLPNRWCLPTPSTV